MPASETTAVFFREEQRFTQPWIWWLLGGVLALVGGVFGFGLVQQLVYDRPWGNNPMSDTSLVLAALTQVAVVGGLVWLFRAMRLVTEVRSDGLHVRFRPFVRKHFPFETIRRCEARTYRPIAEYGGWGIRFGWGGRGKAYNVRGDRGVQLEFTDGKRLLIGSQRAEELEAAIVSRCRREEPRL